MGGGDFPPAAGSAVAMNQQQVQRWLAGTVRSKVRPSRGAGGNESGVDHACLSA